VVRRRGRPTKNTTKEQEKNDDGAVRGRVVHTFFCFTHVHGHLQCGPSVHPFLCSGLGHLDGRPAVLARRLGARLRSVLLLDARARPLPRAPLPRPRGVLALAALGRASAFTRARDDARGGGAPVVLVGAASAAAAPGPTAAMGG